MNIIPLLMIDYIFGIIIDNFLETHILKIANILIYLTLISIAKSRQVKLDEKSIIIAVAFFLKNIIILCFLILLS